MFDGTTGDSYSVNATATVMMQLIKEGKNEEEISAEIVRQFEVEPYMVERHYFEFTNLLRHLNLLD